MTNKMFKPVLLTLFLSAVFLSGCMTVNHQVVKALPEKQSLKSFNLTKDSSSLSVAEAALFEKTLAEKLAKAGFAKGGDNKLTLEYKVVEYNPGNRFLRWLGGFAGAGKANLVMDIKYMSEGKVLSEAKISGERKMGSFGGAAEDLFEEAGEKVADYTISKFK